jgi:hypothetical protein
MLVDTVWQGKVKHCRQSISARSAKLRVSWTVEAAGYVMSVDGESGSNRQHGGGQTQLFSSKLLRFSIMFSQTGHGFSGKKGKISKIK